MKGKDTALTAWEVLDALPPDRRAIRLSTLADFEAGHDALAQGDIARAMGSFAAVLTETPCDVGAKLLLGSCYERLKQGPAADCVPTATRLTEKTW